MPRAIQGATVAEIRRIPVIALKLADGSVDEPIADLAAAKPAGERLHERHALGGLERMGGTHDHFELMVG